MRPLRADKTRAPKTDSLITQRLDLIYEWYRGMFTKETGRLVYTYFPETENTIYEGSPIRDIASMWDVETLSRFLNRLDLAPIIERSLRRYLTYLTPKNGTLILDPRKLDEPSGIAHSAFLILALIESRLPNRESTYRSLAEGILRQQRADGSYKIYFEDEPDDGLEFYPGEAMLALIETYGVTHEPKYLESVERGFAYYRERLHESLVPSDLLVYCANWQSQYARLLWKNTSQDSIRQEVSDYIFGLHDRILQEGYYRELERSPEQQATVEVASALEGINDAYSIAIQTGILGRARKYREAARMALNFLLRAQRLEYCTRREKGGFGHSLTDRTQRIDVTGHAVSALIKSLKNRIEPPSAGVRSV